MAKYYGTQMDPGQVVAWRFGVSDVTRQLNDTPMDRQRFDFLIDQIPGVFWIREDEIDLVFDVIRPGMEGFVLFAETGDLGRIGMLWTDDIIEFMKENAHFTFSMVGWILPS